MGPGGVDDGQTALPSADLPISMARFDLLRSIIVKTLQRGNIQNGNDIYHAEKPCSRRGTGTIHDNGSSALDLLDVSFMKKNPK